MPRAGVDMQKIIRVAIDITEETGIETLTLKEISKRLNVSSASLYNHVNNLAEVKDKVSHAVLEMLKELILRGIIGKSGTDLIRAIGRVYIGFAQEHPYLYETIQWVNVWADTSSQDIFSDIMRLAGEEGSKMGMTEVESNHIIRCLRCLVHGFASIEGHDGFGYKVSAQDSFEYALDMFILGISTKLKQERAKLPKE